MPKKTKQDYVDFQKERNQEFIEIKQEILSFLPVLLSEDAYMNFLQFTAIWNHYSLYNVILLFKQFPGASYIAGFKQWKALAREAGLPENYTIIPSAQRQKGIRLLIPLSLNSTQKITRNRYLGYQCISVFDASQVNQIPTKETFSPHIPLTEMDFSIFLFVLREASNEELLFLQGEPDDKMFAYQEAYLIDKTLCYLETAEDIKEKIFSQFLLYYIKKQVKEDSQSFSIIYKSVLFSLLKYYGFKSGHFVLPEILQLKEQKQEHLLSLLHNIHVFIQKSIYQLYLGFKSFKRTHQDQEQEALLNSIEKEIEEEYLLE